MATAPLEAGGARQSSGALGAVSVIVTMVSTRAGTLCEDDRCIESRTHKRDVENQEEDKRRDPTFTRKPTALRTTNERFPRYHEVAYTAAAARSKRASAPLTAGTSWFPERA